MSANNQAISKQDGYNEKNNIDDNITHEPLDQFVQVDVPADGNCFFHAIVHQLRIRGVPNVNHLILRKFSVDMISEENQDRITGFLIDETFPDYINRMYRSGQWADNIVVNTLSTMLEANIVIYRSDGVVYNNLDFNNSVPTIYLLHIAEMHYKSLVRNQNMVRNQNASSDEANTSEYETEYETEYDAEDEDDKANKSFGNMSISTDTHEPITNLHIKNNIATFCFLILQIHPHNSTTNWFNILNKIHHIFMNCYSNSVFSSLSPHSRITTEMN